ncbi:MAG TPA: hypothetical protein VMT34_01755 [Aggregatilineales bacterium]|nr:hypothetical protein [Aggregatilineales bacterium]
MVTLIKPEKVRPAICPRCGRVQPDMILIGSRLYTEPGRVLVVAYVCSGCEKIVHWGKRSPSRP